MGNIEKESDNKIRCFYLPSTKCIKVGKTEEWQKSCPEELDKDWLREQQQTDFPSGQHNFGSGGIKW